MTKYQLVQCFTLWAVIGCVSLAIGGEKTKNLKPMSDSDGQWTLQSDYSDEFNHPKLDLTKWDNDPRDWGVWSWEPENSWTANGNLHLRMQYKKHTRASKILFYTSGIIKSRAAPIKYGYFEARLKGAPRFPGVCPAFWVYRSYKNDSWTEIDFVELTEISHKVRRIDTNLHAFHHPKLFNGERRMPGNHHIERRHWDAPWDPREGFHVYGCEWNEHQINWYIDGKLVNQAENKYWDRPLDVVMSFGVRDPLKNKPSEEGFPTTFQVDYIRVWKMLSPNKPNAGDGK